MKNFPAIKPRLLLNGGVLSLIVQIQHVAIQLVTVVLLARTLAPDGYGVYSFSFAIVALVQLIHNSGLNNTVIRYGAQYRAKGKRELFMGLWMFGFAASVAYGLCVAFVLVIATQLDWLPESSAVSAETLLIALISIIFLPLLSFLGASIRVIDPGVKGQFPQFLIKPWILITILILCILFSPQLISANIAISMQGLAAFITFFVALYWFNKYRSQQLKVSYLAYEVRAWLSAMLPLFLLGSLMLINTHADVLMLGIFGTSHDVGLYKVASSGASIVGLALAAANIYLAPKVAETFSKGQLDSLQRLLTLSARSTFAVAVVSASIFFLFGSELLEVVFGQAYRSAYGMLLILTLGQLINVGFGSVVMVSNMTTDEVGATKIAGLAAFINILLNVLLIPKLGGQGAALATTTTMLIWNSLMFIRIANRTGLNTTVISRS